MTPPRSHNSCRQKYPKGTLQETAEVLSEFNPNNSIVPTYDEIIGLNPALKSRSREEIQALFDCITSRGFVWDDGNKYFYNKQIGMHVRTQGLDLFDVESFERAYHVWSKAGVAEGARLGQRWIPKILLLFILDLLFGWVFVPGVVWFISLIALLLAVFLIRKVARHKIGLP